MTKLTDEEQEALNTRLAEEHGLDLLTAEIHTMLVQAMAYEMVGLITFHGRPLSLAGVVRISAMLEQGFRLTEKKIHQHTAYFALVGLVDNTDKAHAMMEQWDLEENESPNAPEDN